MICAVCHRNIGYALADSVSDEAVCSRTCDKEQQRRSES